MSNDELVARLRAGFCPPGYGCHPTSCACDAADDAADALSQSTRDRDRAVADADRMRKALEKVLIYTVEGDEGAVHLSMGDFKISFVSDTFTVPLLAFEAQLRAALRVTEAAPAVRGERDVLRFAEAILHGDDEHRAWLREAAAAYVAGQPLPPPRSADKRPRQANQVATTPRCRPQRYGSHRMTDTTDAVGRMPQDLPSALYKIGELSHDIEELRNEIVFLESSLEAAESALALANDRIAEARKVIEPFGLWALAIPTSVDAEDRLETSSGRAPYATVRDVRRAQAWLLASPDSQGQAVPEGWQPMETAPKDGKPILAWLTWYPHGLQGREEYAERNYDILTWTNHNGGGWVHYVLGKPTHWRPLPAAPTPPADSKAEG